MQLDFDSFIDDGTSDVVAVSRKIIIETSGVVLDSVYIF